MRACDQMLEWEGADQRRWDDTKTNEAELMTRYPRPPASDRRAENANGRRTPLRIGFEPVAFHSFLHYEHDASLLVVHLPAASFFSGS
ncbi:MAG TPA: hypothetical protein DGN59_23040 [Candidatus Latescibacteria bacterium]|nr:hypothetical protein [Candidatus Latescibacterota bacterium]